jgi:hypothetical protein
MEAAERRPSDRGAREPSVTGLVGQILGDLETLVRQEIALATQQVQDHIDAAAVSIVVLTVAAGVVGLGGSLLALGAAFAAARVFGWPVWAGLMAIGAVLGVSGLLALASWRRIAGKTE